MIKRGLRVWGAWPARIAAAVLVFYGVSLILSGQVAMQRPPGPVIDPAGSALADSGLFDLFDGIALAVLGLLIAVLTWLSRRSFPLAAFTGLVLSFFAAGLMVVYVLITGPDSRVMLAGLIGGGCLLLAAVTGLIGQSTADEKERPHG